VSLDLTRTARVLEVRVREERTGAAGERTIVFGADRELEEVSSQI
jgi:hypothetical protein